MKLKTTLLILFLLVSSTTILAQTDKFLGTWTLMAVKKDGKDIAIPQRTIRPPDRKFLFIELNGLILKASCNTINGAYVAGKNGRFKYTSTSGTLIECLDDEEGKFEISLAKALLKTTKYLIKGKVLTLRDERAMNVVTLTKAPPVEPAAPNLPVSDWQRFSKCQFTFSAPKTLKDMKAHMIDSCVERFEDDNLTVFIEYGWYRKKFEKERTMQNFKREIVKIDGKPGELVTYMEPDDDGVKWYNASLYVKVRMSGPMTTSLVMAVSGNNKTDLETARQIFKSIKFER